MIKAITFDLDNTLIDFMGMKRIASDMAAKAMVKAGLKMSRKKAKDELFKTYLDEGIESDSAFQRFLREHKVKEYEKVLAAALNAYTIAKFECLKPYKGVVPVLRKLRRKGIKLAIVTDAPKLKGYQRLDAMGITDFFDVVVGYEDTGRRKPSRLPFRKALKVLKVKACEALHVGDWPDKDVKGAKSIGMMTCFARYGYLGLGKVVYADYKINKFSDIFKVLEDRDCVRV